MLFKRCIVTHCIIHEINYVFISVIYNIMWRFAIEKISEEFGVHAH